MNPAPSDATRSRLPRRRARLWPRLLVGALAAVVVIVVLGVIGLRMWVYQFLRSDEFRHFLDEKASVALQAPSHLQPLRWEGTGVYSAALDATGGNGSPFASLDADQIRAQLDLGALWHHAWRIQELDLGKIAVVLDDHPRQVDEVGELRSGASEPQPKPAEGQGAAGFLPSRVEFGEIHVDGLSIAAGTHGKLEDLRVVAQPHDESWEVNGRGGRFTEERFPSVQIDRITLRVNRHELFITQASGQADDGGHVDASGHLELDGARAADLDVHFDGVTIGPFLPEDWRARVHGQAIGTARLTSQATGDWRASGHIELHNGRLEALPLLDQLAVFTASQRYRQTALQHAAGDYEYAGGALTVRNLLVESEGLLRIEGGFTVRAGQIDGTLRVGIAQSAVRWLPGAGVRVFNQPGREGYIWTTMRLTGPATAPHEDLTPRLVAAAADEVIDKAKKTEGTVIDTASGLLNLLKSPP